MHKFFDDLSGDMTDRTIRELRDYICRFTALFSDEIPVEGRMGKYRFCAAASGAGRVRVYWVEIGRERIAVDAVV